MGEPKVIKAQLGNPKSICISLYTSHNRENSSIILHKVSRNVNLDFKPREEKMRSKTNKFTEQ